MSGDELTCDVCGERPASELPDGTTLECVACGRVCCEDCCGAGRGTRCCECEEQAT
jgi:hypothetical protein